MSEMGESIGTGRHPAKRQATAAERKAHHLQNMVQLVTALEMLAGSFRAELEMAQSAPATWSAVYDIEESNERLARGLANLISTEGAAEMIRPYGEEYGFRF